MQVEVCKIVKINVHNKTFLYACSETDHQLFTDVSVEKKKKKTRYTNYKFYREPISDVKPHVIEAFFRRFLFLQFETYYDAFDAGRHCDTETATVFIILHIFRI